MTANAIKASELQQRLLRALRQYRDLRRAPVDLLEGVFERFEFTPGDKDAAISSIYAEAFYGCAKDSDVTLSEQRQLDALAQLLTLDDERVAELNYRVGLTLYKKRFRDAVEDGQLTRDEDEELEAMREYFGLHKNDVRRAISKQALSFYSFLLSDALRDGELSESEMRTLAATARRFGLTAKQLSEISVPNKKEILAAALGSIKARGQILPQDRDHIRSLASFLNATDDLLKPCLMDLDLYERIFAIRSGNLPLVEDTDLILEAGEQLHQIVPTTFETTSGGKTKRQQGTLYVGSLRMRFVGLRKSHEMRYGNLLKVDFASQRSPKIIIVVSSGSGGGIYRFKKNTDPGSIVQLQELVRFLIRKSKGLEERGTGDSRYIPKEVRSEVWFRDNGACVMCGAIEYLEYDHVIPHSKGGATSVENLQLLCRKCNSEKSDSI